ncbi:TonB-dependent siderophore receptor|uniref:Iron complex outermembrane recepter protein n=1 Tax=Dendrosporobacter quercicolus TaxID=146817 RepID=A0A1G9N9V9_9FIRM|nr:TonB-dependent siderophore receptor [Dendrosporobacter quercicolus]NSL47272.1 TonB-dependent siderophore receptor [Dendrosporobacter quercicolus DSM 1736]SDL83183.1 iron complex outermembrane recepter protein [Dendrosporobacter quercicolus]
MQKTTSRTRKSLLYALIGSSLFWHAPVTYAEETPEPVPAAEQTTQGQASSGQTAGQRVFTLEGVEITASRETRPPAYAGGQVARGGNVGVLGNKDFMDTPFSVTSYTAQTMEDQQAATLYDVLINDPTIRFTTPNGHIMENYTIRGFGVSNDHLYFNGLQGLAPDNHAPVEFLERVEVLKGPSSFLYGGVSTSVGGAINLVPKRAGDEDVTAFTADYTSSSQLGGHIDIGRRFGENKEWGIRFNGVYGDGNTETDGQSKERLLGALGLDYRSDKWRLSLDAFGSEEKYDNGSAVSYQLSNGYVKAPDGSTNVHKGTWGVSRNNGILFKSEYDLQDNVTAYAGIGKKAHRAAGFITGNHVRNFQSNGDGMLWLYNQNMWSDIITTDLGVRGKYQTGLVNHELVVGYNSMHQDYGRTNSPSRTGNQAVPTNIYNPTSLTSILEEMGSSSRPNKTSETNLSGLFIADTLSFNEEKVQLTLGVRRQNVKTKNFNLTTGALTSKYDKDATTPAIGLVVKPWDAPVSLYANFIEGLTPGAEVTNTAAVNYGEVFAPYKSKQYEFGAKWDRGTFANTLSFYQIEKPSLLTQTQSDGTIIVSDDAEQRSRGIEWSTFGTINDNTRLLGGIAYTRAEYTREASAKQGHTPYGVPKYQANLGVEWDTPWNPDLTLSVRAIFSSSQYANSQNTVEIPSWIRYDIGARYKTEINKVPVTYRLSVENVFDRNYWSGSFADGYVTLANSRTFKLSATMQL